MIGYSESKANLHDPSLIAKGKRQVKPVVSPLALNLSLSLQDREIDERTCQIISPSVIRFQQNRDYADFFKIWGIDICDPQKKYLEHRNSK